MKWVWEFSREPDKVAKGTRGKGFRILRIFKKIVVFLRRRRSKF